MLVAAPSFAGEMSKVGYVSAAKVFDEYEKTKNADEELMKKGKKKNTEREKLVEDINKLKDEVALLSKEAREKRQDELNEKIRKLQDFDRDTKTALQRERNDAAKEIFKEIDDAIRTYGEDNNYDAIYDDRVFVYVDKGHDITQDIIKLLNRKR